MKELGYVKNTEGLSRGTVTVFHKMVPGLRAQMASELLARWGLVTAQPDGEDSSGRAKFRLETPEELVSRACQVADLAISEMEKRCWFMDIPEPDDGAVDVKALLNRK